MKRLLLFAFVCFLLGTSYTNAGIIVLEGNYQGKNLYIQNPFGSSGVGFCVMEVLVNDQVSEDETNSSAFEIDFKNFKLKLGDKIEVKIKRWVQAKSIEPWSFKAQKYLWNYYYENW